ncbi:hypothetical protein AVEN_212053-1 [Araneus ventricosus]|uniref:Uncharacterized protein n=1 Tax=Araneus ventricosus TaxID=182803 RepID=A0A4Y2MWZ6_ARAVE|nr:hypothetical protein AVEN_212053-1 [Araneus ventricosus]
MSGRRVILVSDKMVVGLLEPSGPEAETLPQEATAASCAFFGSFILQSAALARSCRVGGNSKVSLSKIMGLEVDKNDIAELVEELSQELTTEDLQEFYCVP